MDELLVAYLKSRPVTGENVAIGKEIYDDGWKVTVWKPLWDTTHEILVSKGDLMVWLHERLIKLEGK